MKDINILIKDIACDIIFITTVWGAVNIPYINFSVYFNNKIYNISPILPFIGFSCSIYLIAKYK